MKVYTFIVLIVIFMGCSQEVSKQENLTVQPFSTEELDARVDAIMATMSLDEKLAQIEGVRPTEIIENGAFSPKKAREVMPHGMGHICQFSSALTMSPNDLRDFVREVQNYLMTETQSKIPAIFHEEAITGFATQGATTFPQQIGMGCTWNPEIIRENSNTTRQNMRAAGATYALSPMMDISRTAHWERIEESYGEDAYLTSRLGVAFVKGLQGDDFSTGIAATTKHFAGYGTQNDNPKELYEEYVMPHEAVMKIAGSKSVMPSYGKYKGKAISINEEMLGVILREHLGFDGLVVSDYGAINLVHTGYNQAGSSKEAGVLALKAGMDIEFPEPIAFPHLAEALEEGLITMDVIDAAVKRSLIMKAKLGLLDDEPQIGVDGELDFDPPEYRKLAYESACQSIVILKNNGVLPLKKDVKKIGLLGPNGSTIHCLLGDYTYQSMISFWHSKTFDPNDPKLVSLHEGLLSRFDADVEILQERGCDWSSPLESGIKTDGLGDDRLNQVNIRVIEGEPQPDLERAIEIANSSDVIIAAVGENIYLCGEGREREGIKLPGDQEDFVQKLIDTGKPVVLVMFGGRQQVVSRFEDKCAAIVQAWFPGEEGGNALADILVGNVNPSGKLCVTYPATESKMETNYKSGYEGVEVQYPFGYGLSYTSYEYSSYQMKTKAKNSDSRIPISFSVKNTGAVDGTEIVQLYLSPVETNSAMKPIQLKGFQRVELKAGEEKHVSINVSPQQLAQYIDGQWVVESGTYEFKVGASCTDIRLSGTIEITGEDRLLENGREVFFSINEL